MQVDDRSTIELVRFTFLSELLGGEEELLREVVRVYEGSAVELLAEIERSLTAGELVAARIAAHSLKGASASAGAERMRSLAELLERAVKVEDRMSAAESLDSLRRSLGPTLAEFSRRLARLDGGGS